LQKDGDFQRAAANATLATALLTTAFHEAAA
jgi:hypothetical protein